MMLRFLLAFLVVIPVITYGKPESVEQSLPSKHIYSGNTKELKLVHVIFRHGQRTPADTYPNDKYSNHTFYPYGWGQLTNIGKQNQYKLGTFLRERYDQFLGILYTPSKVYAQSTDPDRAHMSCALTLAGLWPVKNSPLDWDPQLPWSPIPIRSEPLDEDTLLLGRKNCPRYSEAVEAVFKTEQVEKLMKENSNLFKELTEQTGHGINTPDDVQSLYSTLKAEDDFGLTLPSWTKEYYPEKLLPLTLLSYVLNAKTQELKRLKGGLLVKKLINDWSAKAANMISPKDRKIFVYAGHDSTVTNLLSAFGVWESQMPSYGITAIFELYENSETKEFEVEIYLRNSTSVPPTKLIIPGCKEFCPLSKLITLTEDVVPKNWSEECKSLDSSYVAPALSGP